MDIWNVQKQALAALDSDLKQEKEVLEEGFSLLDKCIERLYEVAKQDNEKTRFAVICCFTLVKARRLALGIYTLGLDGLVLEAGALMRLLLEAWQLLIYLHQQPDRVESVLSDRPPRAGDIAATIDIELHNKLKGLREYYNQTSSHISFHEDALVHVNMAFSSESLRIDMRQLDSVICHILYEGTVSCLNFIDKLDSTLAINIDSYREKSLKVFDIDEDLE